MLKFSQKTNGFTLAETLIIIGIIGVVATTTIPTLINNVKKHVRAKKIQNIEHKFSQATDNMIALGVYNGHNSTKEFVNELGKHLKLIKVCDNDNLQLCWPYKKVITRKNGTTWDVADTKLATELKMKNDEFSNWDKTMGIITADGTSMILSYNTKCNIDETKINYIGSKSSTTSCTAAIYDWNGATKPNKYGDDVLSINAKGLHNSCGAMEIGENLCILDKAFQPTSITLAECEKNKDALKIKNCCSAERCISNDYWAGVVKKCGGTDKVPNKAQFQQIAEYIYAGDPVERAAELGLPNPNTTAALLLWSADEKGINQAYYSGFRRGTFVYSNEWRYGGRGSVPYSICLSD